MHRAGVLNPPSQPSMRPVVVPYVASWSAEQAPSSVLVARPGGIGYADESVYDRDEHGVLWRRMLSRRGEGRPLFAQVHPLRQRRAMRRLLCQVCAGPADRTSEGVLWLLQDHREDWPGWPARMGVTEPPICLSCVHTASRLCPALRKGAVTVRARRFPVGGVQGGLYAGGRNPKLVGNVAVSFDNPDIRWVQAASLARELSDCTIVELDALPAVSPCPG